MTWQNFYCIENKIPIVSKKEITHKIDHFQMDGLSILTFDLFIIFLRRELKISMRGKEKCLFDQGSL